MEQQDFYSVKEFAALIGVHQNTVRRSLKAGRLIGFKVGAGKRSIYRIPGSEVQRMCIMDMEHFLKCLTNNT